MCGSVCVCVCVCVCVWCVCVRVCVLLLRRAHQRTDGNAQIPLFADTMTNDVSVAFGALPERLAIVLNGACCPSVPFTFTFSVTHAMSCEATQFGAPVHPAAFALVSIHMHAHAMQHAHHHGHPPPPPPPHTHTHTHTHTGHHCTDVRAQPLSACHRWLRSSGFVIFIGGKGPEDYSLDELAAALNIVLSTH
jgi:hypothetical protein